MMHRQRVLLYLIDRVQSRTDYMKTAADKFLFLLRKEYGFGDRIKFYSFYPYRYGPFSELFYYDLRKLDQGGFLKNERVTPAGALEA